jgi:hypothetical protein
MQDQFIVFEEYAKTVKIALENILHDYNMGDKDKVQVIYATPPVAFASFSQNTVNGEDPGPLVSFYLKGIEIDAEDQLGGFTSILLQKRYNYKAPIVAKLQYEVTINAIKESQADLLQAQIMMAMPFNRPYATKLNGQWVTMEAKDFENASTIEIETDKDKTSKRTLRIEIPRAYFDYPIQENDRFIQSINSHIFSVEKVATSIQRSEKDENN